ncbi:DUF6247 family protein [Streptosporangium minutum]|uniref:DUF6247 family protein n=1 Tax=Streptosporangium minutum TaxID=569862 RepID=UPI001F60F008|nr:DUF6247 family protein [Streptosporangium minutum]
MVNGARGPFDPVDRRRFMPACVFVKEALEAGRYEKNLRAIRAALVVPQDRGALDAGLKAVLDEVRVSLDLGALNGSVHRWWISACDSVKDSGGRRRMCAKAEQIAVGKLPLGGSLGGKS